MLILRVNTRSEVYRTGYHSHIRVYDYRRKNVITGLIRLMKNLLSFLKGGCPRISLVYIFCTHHQTLKYCYQFSLCFPKQFLVTNKKSRLKLRDSK